MTRKLMSCLLTMIVVSLLQSAGTCQDDDEVREKFAEAQEATQAEDFEKAVEILRELNETFPDRAVIQFNLGYNLHAAGQLDEAIEFHKKSVKSDQFKPTALYNLACAYSIKKEADKSFDYLKQAIEAGFESLDTLENDVDFKNVKDDPRFAEMVAWVKNGGKPPMKLTKDKLYGEWKIVSGSRSGEKIDSARLPTIKITKKSFTIPSGEEGADFVMSYKLEMDAKPITVDFKIESGPVPEGNAKGIIKFKDGEMTLCYEPTGKDRPEKFLSTEENGFFVFKMKPASKTQTKGDKAEMVKAVLGKWKCVKGQRGGKKIDAERMASIITIDKKLITIPVSEDEGFEMSYKIDSSKDPIAIDMKIEAGPAPEGSKALGIIKIEDGKFFLCYDPEGVDRPEKFESTESGGEFLFEMKSHK